MAWAFVTGAASANKTVTKSVTSNNLLVCGFACGDGTSTPTISDGVNSWTLVGASPVKDATNAASVSMWWAIAATTASITITITATPTSFNGTAIAEYSGNAAASLDAGSAGTANIPGNTGVNAMLTGAFTPSSDGCLIVSLINDDGGANGSVQYTAGTTPITFTKRTTCSIDPGSETTYAMEDGTQVTAASINPSWTEALAHTAVAISAAFKPTSGAASNQLMWVKA